MNMFNNQNLKLRSGKAVKGVFRLFLLSMVMVTFSACSTAPVRGADIKRDEQARQSFQLRQQAEIAYQSSHWIEAVQLYQKLIEINPGDSGAWFRLGNIYAQQGAYQRAISAYESSLTQDPNQPKALFNLSTAYLLNAQAAMRSAHSRLRDGDPAKILISERLNSLSALVHGRLEENQTSTNYRF